MGIRFWFVFLSVLFTLFPLAGCQGDAREGGEDSWEVDVVGDAPTHRPPNDVGTYVPDTYTQPEYDSGGSQKYSATVLVTAAPTSEAIRVNIQGGEFFPLQPGASYTWEGIEHATTFMVESQTEHPTHGSAMLSFEPTAGWGFEIWQGDTQKTPGPGGVVSLIAEYQVWYTMIPAP